MSNSKFTPQKPNSTQKPIDSNNPHGFVICDDNWPNENENKNSLVNIVKSFVKGVKEEGLLANLIVWPLLIVIIITFANILTAVTSGSLSKPVYTHIKTPQEECVSVGIELSRTVGSYPTLSEIDMLRSECRLLISMYN